MFQERLKSRPTGKPLLACYSELRITQRHPGKTALVKARNVMRQPLGRFRISRFHGLQQTLGLLPVIFEVEASCLRTGRHTTSFQNAPIIRKTGRKKVREPAEFERWENPCPRTGSALARFRHYIEYYDGRNKRETLDQFAFTGTNRASRRQREHRAK